ncbi:MAG: AAA family ATPase, partial [Pseudomonadota bacterium]
MTSGRAIGLEAGCVRSLAIAAPRSGAGKTVLTLGIARALAERGVRIGCAKAGPDYIDPGFHQVACGRPSVNLDGWATPKEALLSMARRAAPPGGVLLIETAMGVLDGAAGPSPVVGGGDGSAAALASVLECPILLVLDVQKQAQSAALAVAGLRALRPDLNLAGVVLNRVASERHGRVVRRAIEALGAPVLGCAPRDDRLRAPERHLGLVQARERPNLETFIRQAAS